MQMTMWQTDETFISILKRICSNSQTCDDIAYINTNCICPTPNDTTFPYLFYRNKDVMHNKKMMPLMPGNEILIYEIEEHE